jgi:hypothetical protein
MDGNVSDFLMRIETNSYKCLSYQYFRRPDSENPGVEKRIKVLIGRVRIFER